MSQGDTPNHGREPKCLSCKYATIVRGFAVSEIYIRCQELAIEVPFPVYECSTYMHRLETEKWEMEQIAYILRRKGATVGFHAPKNRTED